MKSLPIETVKRPHKRSAWRRFLADSPFWALCPVRSLHRLDHDPSGDEQGYVETASLRDEKELAQEALASEISRIRSLIIRAQSIAAALGLEASLEKMLKILNRQWPPEQEERAAA